MPSLSLPLRSHCSVAGKAALSASTLYYVTGGNTHTHAPSLSLSLSLKQTPHKYHNDDRDTFGVRTGALPLYILYIRMCALKLFLFSAVCTSPDINHSPGLKVQPGVHGEGTPVQLTALREYNLSQRRAICTSMLFLLFQ